MTIYTIGHSTRSGDEFAEILEAFKVRVLVDIRTIPRSRRNPQFEGGTLEPTLRKRGIDYLHMRALGGLRHPKKDSANGGWRNESFRGYADYMQTNEYSEALTQLMKQASKESTAIMCAEALPWRCHRSLVGDTLVVRGVKVIDILSATKSQEHQLTAWARVEGARVTYPPDAEPRDN